jgi:hypothetical protein
MYGCRTAFPVTVRNMINDDGARHRREAEQQRRDGNAVQITVIISAVVVIVAVIGGAVALSLAGREPEVIVGLIGPTAAAAGLLIAALGKLVQLDRKQDAQTEKIEQVAHQTNGAMRETMRQVMREELAAQRDAEQP